MTESIQCPKCKNFFDSQDSYQSHLPCDVGGLRETVEEHIAKDDTGIRPS